MFSCQDVSRAAILTAFIASVGSGLLRADDAADKASPKKSYSLTAKQNSGALTRVKAALEVKGDLLVLIEGKPTKFSLEVAGNTLYDQRLLRSSDLSSGDARAIRQYQQADALITINKRAVPQRHLAEDRRLVGVESKDHQTTMFSPQGNLRRDDLDLISLPFDSLLVEGLLPKNEIAIGSPWKTSAKVLAQLLGLDKAQKVNVQSILKTVDDNVARFETSGTIEGTVDGASSKIRLRANTSFDLKAGRVIRFAISFHEKRGASLVAPGVDATTRFGMKIRPISESAELTDAALAGMQLRSTAPLRRLRHRSAGGHFQFDHNRCWHVVSDERKLSVLRLVKDGEFIAHLDISPLPAKQPGRTTSLDEFKNDIRTSLDKNFGQFTQVSQQANAEDYRVYRVVALGETSNEPIQWIYYYIADKHGRNVALSFTLSEKLVEKFDGADKPLVASLRLLERPVPTAAKDEEAKK